MGESPLAALKYKLSEFQQWRQSFENRIVNRRHERWGAAALCTVLYILRIALTRKFVSITYFMYIYVLSAFLQFISPKSK